MIANEAGDLLNRELFDRKMNIHFCWGYVDKTGKIVIPPQFQRWAGKFSNGLAPVCGVKCGYINKTGKFVWEGSDEGW